MTTDALFSIPRDADAPGDSALTARLAPVADLLRRSQAVAVLTGAGVSAESGIATFRDAQTGLWALFDAEDLASRGGFLRDPGRSWRWYAERRARVRAAVPNAGHVALAAMERRLPGMVVVTQNVDGLHQRAGSRKVVELHGSLERVRCFEEDEVVDSGELDALADGWGVIDARGEYVEHGRHPEHDGHVEHGGNVEHGRRAEYAEPPRCPRCSAYLRPDVVWFGESLAPAVLRAAFDAALGCDLFLSVGTSGLVEPASWLAYSALERGVPVVEVNLEPTPLTPYATHVLAGKAGDVLPALVRAAWGDEGDSLIRL